MLGRTISSKSRYNWLYAFLTNKKNNYPPINYFLLSTFLERDTFELATVDYSSHSWFGNPPYVCRNLVCPNFEKAVISEHDLDFTFEKKPRATLSCTTCGFVYSVIGPKTRAEMDSAPLTVIERGFMWENRLRELWFDNNYGVQDLSVILGTFSTKLKKYAAKLDLPFPRPVNNLVKSNLIRPSIETGSINSLPERTQRMRRIWVETMAQYPDYGRSQLRDISPEIKSAYRFLVTYDRDWYELNSPSPGKHVIERRLAVTRKWVNLDSILVAEVQSIANEIYSLHGTPQRVSMYKILHMLDYNTSTLKLRKSELSETFSVLDEVSESPKEFMLRRVKWYKMIYMEKKKIPTIGQFKKDIRVYRRWDDPDIVNAVEAALQEITDFVNKQTSK